MVLLRFKRSTPKPEIDRIFGELAGLQKKVPGILSFSGGPYSSPEGMQKGFTHGFCMTFQDAASRDAYLPHPEHMKVVGEVLKILKGGVKGALAFDFEA